MANYNMTSVKTGKIEGPEYGTHAEVNELRTVTLGGPFGLNDTITGPSIPPGAFVTGVTVDVGQGDTNATPTMTFICGVAGNTSIFMATSTMAQTGGIQHATGPACLAYTPPSNTPVPVIITITAVAATNLAAKWTMRLRYSANP